MNTLPEIANSSDVIESMQEDACLRKIRHEMFLAICRYKYSYNFTWFGRPIIQLPDDIVMLQELILSTKPDMIVETGVAHGGSLVFYASMLELLGNGIVVGIDIDIKEHNRKAIEEHPMSKRIVLFEGSSTDGIVVEAVRHLARVKRKVMVLLDSDHTHQHVLRELQLYSQFVPKGSYVVVFDTAIEDMPDGSFPDRPWGKVNNPKTAVLEFLKSSDRFVLDEAQRKLMLTCAPGGYLKCVKD